MSGQSPSSACSKEYVFPQGNPAKDTWKHRVVGPFATPHFARGGNSVALTLVCLGNLIDALSADITFSTGLDLKQVMSPRRLTSSRG